MLNNKQSRFALDAGSAIQSGQHILGSPANEKSFEIINVGKNLL